MRSRLEAIQEPSALVLMAAALAVLASVVQCVAHGFDSRWPFVVVFAGAVAVGEVLQVRMPGDLRQGAPLSMAAGLALAVTISDPTNPRPTSSYEVVAIYAVGQLVGGLALGLGRRRPGITMIACRLLGVAGAALCAAGLYRLVRSGILAVEAAPWWVLLHIAVVSLSAVVTMVLFAVISSRSARFAVRVQDEIDNSGIEGIAIVASAVLIAIGRWDVGLWAVPIFLLPLLLTLVSLRQFAIIRGTQRQTIQALSRAPEIAGYTEPGHAARVAATVLAMGGDLGLRARRLRRLESAALMHDVGQLSLPEPIPAGATVAVTATQQLDIARRGAEVIRRTGVMDQVADVVELSAVPYATLTRGRWRGDVPLPGAQPDGTVPPELLVDAAIVNAANAFDDLVGPEPTFQRQQQALERLRLQAASIYDPVVLDALDAVVARSRHQTDWWRSGNRT